MGRANDDAILARIHERLASELRRIREEIRRYPAPIPACDAQFNYLLESREALSAAIARLGELMSDGSPDEPLAKGASIDALLDASVGLGDTMRSEIRAIIDNESRGGEVGQ